MDEHLPRAPVALARGALVGAAGGALFGVLSGGAYVLANREAGPAWLGIGAAYLVYAALSGALVAGGVAGATAMLDRIAGGRVWAAPLPAAILGGAIGCALPGAVGGGVFAAQRMPFMGGVGMFAVPVAGALVVAVALAAHDRALSARAARVGAVVGVAALLAALVGGLVALGARRLGDEAMLERLRAAAEFLTPSARAGGSLGWEHARTGLVALGLCAGALLGALLGAYVGAVMACARRLR